MRSRASRLASFCLVLALAACANAPAPRAAPGKEKAKARAERPTRPDQLTFSPLEVEIPKPERIELENGMVLYYLEDHQLPLVDMTMWFRAGGVYDPADETGLAAFTAAYARNGGAAGMSRLEFDGRLEFLAANVGVSIADEHGEAGLSVMKKDLDEGMKLLAAVLRHPDFDPQIFPLLKQSFARNIMSQLDSPGGVLAREFPHLVYGDHPYGRVPTLQTIGAITRDDCVALWRKYVVPNSMIVGISGDLTKDEAVAAVKKAFGDWEPQEVEYPEVPEVTPTYEEKLYVIPRTESQSHIRLGSIAVKRTDPDRVVCDVMNLILGGSGFSSRLTEVVRVREGLAYDVGSYFTRQIGRGLFTASVQTKAETTYKALSLILAEMRRIQDEPVSDEELAQAKDMVLNGLVFGYSDPFGVVDNYVSLEYYGYPRDWIRIWKERIESVTKEDVQRVAKEYLHPDGSTIVIAGNPEQFDARPKDLPEPTVLEAE